MKQETLEEVAKSKYGRSIYDYEQIDAFVEGGLWQAERMYSEAIKFGKWLDENIQQREYYPMSTMTMEELFEQFKKKV